MEWEAETSAEEVSLFLGHLFLRPQALEGAKLERGWPFSFSTDSLHQVSFWPKEGNEDQRLTLAFDQFGGQVQTRFLRFSLALLSQWSRSLDDHPGMFPPGKEVQMVNVRAKSEVKWVISNGQKVKCRQQSSGKR